MTLNINHDKDPWFQIPSTLIIDLHIYKIGQRRVCGGCILPKEMEVVVWKQAM